MQNHMVSSPNMSSVSHPSSMGSTFSGRGSASIASLLRPFSGSSGSDTVQGRRYIVRVASAAGPATQAKSGREIREFDSGPSDQRHSTPPAQPIRAGNSLCSSQPPQSRNERLFGYAPEMRPDQT
jgi:hypothetical protein